MVRQAGRQDERAGECNETVLRREHQPASPKVPPTSEREEQVDCLTHSAERRDRKQDAARGQ